MRAAERAAAFQSEQIGIANAGLVPSVSVSGSVRLEASTARGFDQSKLFDGNSFVGSSGPTSSWPALNDSQIVNNIRVQDAAEPAPGCSRAW